MNEIRNILALLAVGLAVSGCATGRIADLKDCGTFSVGVGLGLDATAKVGCLLHPSVGLFGATSRVGLENRQIPFAWNEVQIVWPVLTVLDNNLSQGFGGSRTPLLSYQRFYCGHSDFATLWIPALIQKKDRKDWNPFSFHELTDFEVGATLVFISGRVGINPLEIIDFLLGFVGLDIANDDPKKEDKEKPTTESTPTK